MRRAALLGLVLLLTGCGTIIDLDTFGPRLMGGVRHDWRQIGDPDPADRVLVPFYCIDMPISIAADIVLLPISIAKRLTEPEPPAQPADQKRSSASR